MPYHTTPIPTPTMSILLFSLRGVPDDETYEIKELLTENNIDYYETSAGNWGISMPALWLRTDKDLFEAQQLLNAYHHNRAITQQEIYKKLKQERGNKRLLDALIEKPLRFIIYTGSAAFIIYISIKMIFEFGL